MGCCNGGAKVVHERWNLLPGLNRHVDGGKHFVSLQLTKDRLTACETCDARAGNACALGRTLDAEANGQPGMAHYHLDSCPKGRWPGERPICSELGRPLTKDEAGAAGVDVTKCGCLNKLRKCSVHGQCTTGERREGFACCAGCADYVSSDPGWTEAASLTNLVDGLADAAALGEAELRSTAEAKARSLARLPPATTMTVDVPERPVQPEPSKLGWAVGVMTVPERRDRLLPLTLEQLGHGGFEPRDIRLFVDGAVDHQPWERFGCGVTLRNPRLGIHGNWLLALHELVVRSPHADRFVIFQDDLMCVKHLRPYLERCPFPERGYLNLFNFWNNPHESPHGPRAKGHLGWYLSDQLGKGALGLVFDRENVVRMLSSARMIKRPLDTWDHSNPIMRIRGTHAVDGGVVESMKEAGCQEWVHYPSLLYHTGEESTQPLPTAILAGRDASKAEDRKRWTWNAASFNTNFDPLTLLK